MGQFSSTVTKRNIEISIERINQMVGWLVGWKDTRTKDSKMNRRYPRDKIQQHEEEEEERGRRMWEKKDELKDRGN